MGRGNIREIGGGSEATKDNRKNLSLWRAASLVRLEAKLNFNHWSPAVARELVADGLGAPHVEEAATSKCLIFCFKGK